MKNMNDKNACKARITSYWKNRSESFQQQRRAELHHEIAKRWMIEIKKYIPENRKLKILDVGCGAGFFSILLAKEGHEVIGIDLTPDMIIRAEQLAKEEEVSCSFIVMDAENPNFSDETFDIVISRNLTWTLPNAAHAYSEWNRILKQGGLLLNFDGDYGKYDNEDTSGLPEKHAHCTMDKSMMHECEEIKKQLEINSMTRPDWDLYVLKEIGIEKFSLDFGISKRIYPVKDEFYNPVPLFAICAVK